MKITSGYISYRQKIPCKPISQNVDFHGLFLNKKTPPVLFINDLLKIPDSNRKKGFSAGESRPEVEFLSDKNLLFNSLNNIARFIACIYIENRKYFESRKNI